MRIKTPPTNILFNVKSHALGVQGGAGEQKYISVFEYHKVYAKSW